MSAPKPYSGYDVIDTSPAENWYVLDVVRAYNQIAECFIVGWYEKEKYLACVFSTQDDLSKLRQLRDNLTRVIETKLEHRL